VKNFSHHNKRKGIQSKRFKLRGKGGDKPRPQKISPKKDLQEKGDKILFLLQERAPIIRKKKKNLSQVFSPNATSVPK